MFFLVVEIAEKSQPILLELIMIGNRTVLAVIAARSGSKGVPGKNIKDLAGLPLIAWTIQSAADSKFIDRLLVSTDDPGIAEVAQSYGAEVPFLRPSHMATDDSSVISALLHMAENIPDTYDYLVLLQPTSPLRRTADIDGAISLCDEKSAPACVSVCSAPKIFWTYKMTPSGALQALFPEARLQRQYLPSVYQPNGAVYVARLDWLRNTGDFYSPETLGFIMPQERSIDIDTASDFLFADTMMRDKRS